MPPSLELVRRRDGLAARHGLQGIALLEALIAVLVLSFAALGYAGLQLRSLTANRQAMWRSQAVQLASDMADRMRANRDAVRMGQFDLLTGATAAPGCGNGSRCTPAAMALRDHAHWSATLATAMPSGAGTVCLDSTPDDGQPNAPACDGSGSVYAVKVFWREKDSDARLVIAVRP